MRELRCKAWSDQQRRQLLGECIECALGESDAYNLVRVAQSVPSGKTQSDACAASMKIRGLGCPRSAGCSSMYVFRPCITGCSQDGSLAPYEFTCIGELARVCGAHVRQAERMVPASYNRRSTVLRRL
eukprot:103510-Pleurochrysis_carterae.AAC.2